MQTNICDLDVDASELPSNERFGLYLVYNLNDPSTKDIEQATGFSDQYARTTVRRLKRKGLIEPIPDPSEPRCNLWQPATQHS